MEEASWARKERLAALKKRKIGSEATGEEGVESTETNEGEKPVLRFRNYTPLNEEIKAQSIIKIGTPTDVGDTVEKQVDQLTREVEAAEEAKRAEEVDLLNLAPKKSNWDLKRDVEKKVAKLNRRTQIAIAQLISTLKGNRIRLNREVEAKIDLADAVNSQEKAVNLQANKDSGDEDSE
ncbi:hypothetical protein G9A89_015983 [Geosiphon pyriformis]|nr:hypothetical protein G9A89_015983 [Geosiphon pyriformis]